MSRGPTASSDPHHRRDHGGASPLAPGRPSSCATSARPSARWSRCGPVRWSSQPRSIHALVGENGAGKSTLVKIVAGVHRRDSGEFLLEGRSGRLRVDRRVEGPGRRGDLPGAHAVPGPVRHREHLHGPPAGRGRSPDRPRRDVRRGGAALPPPRRPHRPPPPGRGTVDRGPADHRDRQGDLARREAAHHGRADGGAQRRGGRAACSPSPAACATRVGRWSSSPTGSTRSSRCATPSR